MKENVVIYDETVPEKSVVYETRADRRRRERKMQKIAKRIERGYKHA